MVMDANPGDATAPSCRSDEIDPHAGQLPGVQSIPCLGRFHFKVAETDAELEQVHRLNYRTFVQEIPQHGDNGTGRLIDKFHDWNTYFLALDGEQLIGMLS